MSIKNKVNKNSIVKNGHVFTKVSLKAVGAAHKGTKAWNWKGDDVGYFALHDWALKKDKRYERKRNNFKMLCRSCHLKQDRNIKNK